MSFSYSPKIVTDGLCFFVDTINKKCRARGIQNVGGAPFLNDTITSATGGTMTELIKGGKFTLLNGAEVSSDFKHIALDGVDDHCVFTTGTRRQPFVYYKPSTFSMSFWAKSGTTGAGGVMFFAGYKDYSLDYTPLTGTSYSQGVYLNVSGTNVNNASRTVPTFNITVDSSSIITNVEALSSPHTSLSGDTILITGDQLGGATPLDDAYFRFKIASSSNSRWGIQIGINYSMFLSNSDEKNGFGINRAANEPNEWNCITFTDEGQLLTAGNRRWYVNGELVKSSLASETPFLNGSWMPNPATGKLFIGKGGSSFSTFVNGDVGSLMMYDRALTSDEVLQNYNAIKNRYL
tara:strand:- start:115 stop:1161 length:1047 start_codon:yes stop_codon:yes gene_type:complete